MKSPSAAIRAAGQMLVRPANHQHPAAITHFFDTIGPICRMQQNFYKFRGNRLLYCLVAEAEGGKIAAFQPMVELTAVYDQEIRWIRCDVSPCGDGSGHTAMVAW